MRRNRFVLAEDAGGSSPPLQRPRGLKKKEVPPRADWRLETSIWARRPEVSDSGSFYDTDEVMRRALGCDWARAGKERGLFSYIKRKDDGDNGSESESEGEGDGAGAGEGGGDGGVGEAGGGGGGGGGEGEGEGEGEAGEAGKLMEEAGEYDHLGLGDEVAAEVIDHADEEAEARRAAEAAEVAAKVEAARELEAGELGEVGEVLTAMGQHAQLVPRRTSSSAP